MNFLQLMHLYFSILYLQIISFPNYKDMEISHNPNKLDNPLSHPIVLQIFIGIGRKGLSFLLLVLREIFSTTSERLTQYQVLNWTASTENASHIGILNILSNERSFWISSSSMTNDSYFSYIFLSLTSTAIIPIEFITTKKSGLLVTPLNRLEKQSSD